MRDIFGSCNFLEEKQKKKSKNLAISELSLMETTELEQSHMRFFQCFGVFSEADVSKKKLGKILVRQDF